MQLKSFGGGVRQGWAIIFKKILFKEDWFCEDKL